MVAEIVRGVLTSMRGDLTVNEAARCLPRVEELAQTVASARAEIAALGADDITESHIPSATDELDAIVSAHGTRQQTAYSSAANNSTASDRGSRTTTPAFCRTL